MDKKNLAFYGALSIIFVLAVLIKVLYINTAESSFNSEELPLASMILAGDGRAVTDVAVTRLYGTSYLTTALSLYFFGFDVLGLKMPNIIFFFSSILFLACLAARLFSVAKSWIVLLPSALLCFGPPVMQIWGMKNRGGFIENIFALTVCLWICAGVRDRSFSLREKFLVAVIVGLATWSQPIALVWGICVFAYINLYDLRWLKIGGAFKGIAIQAGGFALGVLPLIALNILFNLNTIKIVEAGEFVGNLDLGYFGRAKQLVFDGIPRVLGLKEQWSTMWVLPRPLALVMYVFFIMPAFWGAWKIVGSSIRRRELNVGLLVIAVGLAILAANVISTWGNFQQEPRRLLLVYITLVILIAYGFRSSPWGALVYFFVWLMFNGWSNYLYVSKHLNGFSNRHYQSMNDVAEFLAQEGVRAIYTDVWTGSRVTFESKGRLPWYASRYVITSYGYVGDDELKYNEAIVFDLGAAAGKQGRGLLLQDLNKSKISCREKIIEEYSIFYKCSEDFRFGDLGVVRGEPGELAVVRVAGDPELGSQVGRLEDGKIIANGEAGFLLYGPYVRLQGGRYKIVIEGSTSRRFVLDITSEKGSREHFRIERDGGQGQGILIAEDFDLLGKVSDLEVRIKVPFGSDAEILGYRIIYR